MDPHGIIGIYTTLQGWRLYGVVWDVLTGTGLALLPFLGLLFDAVQQSRARGSMLNNDADSTISFLEVGLFRMLLVIAIAFVPSGVTRLDASQLTHEGNTATDNDTRYVETYGADLAITGTSVSIPVWWWLTMGVSNGITKAVIDEVGTDNAYRDLEASLRNGQIENPDTRYRAQVFKSECWAEARHRYFTNGDTGGGANIDWIGSEYLYDNYYEGMNTRTILPGYAYNVTAMPEFESDPGTGGRPTCKVLWDALQLAIYAEADAQGTTRFWEGMFGTPDADTQRKIVHRYLMNTPLDQLYAADEVADIRSRKGGWVENTFEWLGGHTANVGLGFMVFVMRGATDAVVIGASTIQAYILMFIYMTIPIALLVSGYSLSFLVTGAMVIFSVIFWSALFAIIAHADTFLAKTLLGSLSTDIVDKIINPRELTKELVHSLVILGLYVTVPTVMTWMLAAAGSRAANALIHMGGMSGSGSAAGTHARGAISSATRAQSAGALNAINKRLSK